MRVPSESDMLALWEYGLSRHPIDRALLFCAWARPELPPSRLPELPLGALNEALLRLREACFGPRIDAHVDCERCGERLELSLDTGQLLTPAREGDARAELDVAGFRFRAPCSRDLASISQDRDTEAAALKLLEHCRADRADSPLTEDAGLLAEIEAGLEALDPLADIGLALACEDCGHRWVAGLDIGALLWDEIEACARALFAEVHSLAKAYGWTEPEILALSPRRRAAYLDMVGA